MIEPTYFLPVLHKRNEQFTFYLTSRKADMVMTDEPSTRKASHPLAASIAESALSLGTLSPKKTTYKETKQNY